MPVFSPGKSHRQRSLAGYSPWGLKESDMTEQLTIPLFQPMEILYGLNTGEEPKTVAGKCMFNTHEQLQGLEDRTTRKWF